MLKSDVPLNSAPLPDDQWWPEIKGLSCGKPLLLALKLKALGFYIFLSKHEAS